MLIPGIQYESYYKKRDAKIEMILITVVYLRIGTKKMKCSKRKKMARRCDD